MPHSARDVLTRLGAPPLDHTSKNVTQSLVEQADVIVCMTHGQCRSLTERFPKVSAKILPLDPQGDIPDHEAAAGENALPVARRIRDLVRQQLARDLMLHLAQA